MASRQAGKYARVEVESRYLVTSLPPGLMDSQAGWQIIDRYLPNTRLRLRRMQSLSTGEEVYKLTQKYRAGAQNASEAIITNIYLSEAEFRLFDSLDARILTKKRYPWPLPPLSLSIDIFEGHRQGLILAELEWQEISKPFDLVMPPFLGRDVTEDPFFTGGALASMTDEEFHQGLSRRFQDYDLAL